MNSHPEQADTLIVGARLIDGTGSPAVERDVAVRDGRIVAITAPGGLAGWRADAIFEAEGRVLAPGFIDVHTHDDTHVIRSPQMLPKLTQGVTTVIVGNCGISASPVTLKGDPPDPMNLLGDAAAFKYPTFAAYVDAVNAARPAVNVGALIGHTALRNNHMDRLDRAATPSEVEGMRAQNELLREWSMPADSAAELEPRPGFYARVLDQISTQRPVSIWALFTDSILGRRLAIASMAAALALGLFVISGERNFEEVQVTEQLDPLYPTAGFPTDLMAANNTSSAVFMNLVSYEGH